MVKNILSLISIVVLLFLLDSSTFTLPEYQQALILQFGKVQGDPVTRAGLHWKVPFVQEVRYFDKRILQWDGERGEIPTKDKKFIWVDTTARWRIHDALLFYKAVRDIPNAILRMGTILDGVTKDTVSSFNLIEAVRNSNNILEDIRHNRSEAEKRQLSDSSDTTMDELTTDVESIQTGREKLSELISSRARRELESFGIAIIDVQLRSIAYKEVVEQKVYHRMISEREKIATKIRSSGKGEEAKIVGQLNLKLKQIESEAYRKAQTIKGRAEAEAAEIFAGALKADPAYFEFIKTLDAYKKTLKDRGEFILSTDNAFLKLLKRGG
ncbi:MAG: protease modulator HflC [Deltaproteobacteria bacterium]|nr:protease modulator HflC [Deltaproteobacteria bacterium]